MDETHEVCLARKPQGWFYGLEDEFFVVYGPFHSKNKAVDHLNWRYSGWSDTAELVEGVNLLTDAIVSSSWAPEWGEPLLSLANKKAADYVVRCLNATHLAKAAFSTHYEEGHHVVFACLHSDKAMILRYEDEARAKEYRELEGYADVVARIYSAKNKSRTKKNVR